MIRLTAPIFKLKREAKLLARKRNIPLHEAQNAIAISEGFQSWSHLTSSVPDKSTGNALLDRLDMGDLVLLGARPRQGKTRLGLELLVAAIKQNHQGYFFTLDYNEIDVLRTLRQISDSTTKLDTMFTLETSDAICAEYIVDQLQNVRNAVVVVDYMQLLDQKRCNAPLAEQIEVLKILAKANQIVIVLLSQIHRSYDLKLKSLPDISDVRLPNPVDCSHFTKTCFLHDGNICLETV